MINDTLKEEMKNKNMKNIEKINIGTVKTWDIEKMTGYKPRTTFYEDFSIADHFGSLEVRETSVRDTYYRAFNTWKNNIEYMTELVMVLNWKFWEHYRRNYYRLAEMYDELWREADCWVVDHFDGDDLQYYFGIEKIYVSKRHKIRCDIIKEERRKKE